MRWPYLLLTLSAATLCFGCGATVLEKHVFQTTDEYGWVGYYQLEISGKASLSKASYRAGLYDAEALDALFGGLDASEDSLPQTLERKRREAVGAIAARYYETLGDPSKSPEDVRALEARLAVAMRSPYLVSSADEKLGVTSPRRKYAFMLTAKASEIETAIASFAEEKATRDTLLTAFSSLKRDAYLKTQVESSWLDQLTEVLRLAHAEACSLEPPAAGAANERQEAFIRKVSDLTHRLSALEAP